jgi:nitrogen fixation NifU-like protein
MNSLYSKKVIEYFKKPRNMGKMKNYDGLGKAQNPSCGDIIYFYIKVAKNRQGKEIIKKASFLTLGCPVAIANGSLLTTLVEGKTLEKAMKITKNDLLKKLGKIPPFKIHCSILAIDALSEAIYDYLSKNKKEIPKELKKRHERIEREKKEIEKQYKKFELEN